MGIVCRFSENRGTDIRRGVCMLPMLEKEAIEKKGWITNEELLDFYAVAQCTPGIIASNTASLIGYRVKGTAGALAAALGVVSPSYVIITIIAAFTITLRTLKLYRMLWPAYRSAWRR